MSWKLFAAATLWMVACGEPAADSGGSTSSSSSSSSGSCAWRGFDGRRTCTWTRTLTNATLAFQQGLCDKAERCKDSNGRLHSNAFTCLDQAAAFATYVGGSFAGRYSVPSTADISGCVLALENQPCEDLSTPEVCKGLTRPMPAVPLGGTCDGAGRQCDNGLVCDGQVSPGCLVCSSVTTKENGLPCSSDAECTFNHCEASGVCAAVPWGIPKGGACGGTPGECRGFLSCVPAALGSLAGTCQELPGEGDVCVGTCLADLYCQPGEDASRGICVGRLRDGYACLRRGPQTCLNLCAFDSPTAAAGRCSTLAQLPGDGEPCALSSSYPSCSENAFPELVLVPDPPSCTCRARKLDGAACTAARECLHGDCGQDGVCHGPQHDGEPCLVGAQCEGGQCIQGACGSLAMCL